jgi:hypothetical protein
MLDFGNLSGFCHPVYHLHMMNTQTTPEFSPMMMNMIMDIKHDSRILTEAEQNERMRQACNPVLHTELHAQAVAEWNRVHGYNGEVVPYEQMTSDQRTWVNIRAQQLVVARG